MVNWMDLTVRTQWENRARSHVIWLTKSHT